MYTECMHNLSVFSLIFFLVSFFSRLEYEQNRDMETRINELESSISALQNDLELIEKREADAKSAAEKAIREINELKDEVNGMAM